MKDKKIPYDNVKVEVVKFSGEDLIATSGGNDYWPDMDGDGGDWS